MDKVIKRNYTDKDSKDFGGFLKKALPVAGVAANFIPGVGPLASAGIGAVSKGISSSIPNDQNNTVDTPANYVSSSYGGNYAEGGNILRSGNKYMDDINSNSQSIGQDARKFEGKSHEQGGIDIGDNSEVEGNETTDKVNGQDYVFSKRLKVPGTYKTFAKAHEELVKKNAPKQKIDELANLQEKVAGRK